MPSRAKKNARDVCYRIAGTPLEVNQLQRRDEINSDVICVKMINIGQSAAKLRTGERSTTKGFASL